MGEIKKGNHIMKLFNWLRGLFRREVVHVFRKPRTDHGDPSDWVWVNHDGAIIPTQRQFHAARLRSKIETAKRNKKKHSHLQKELDALIDSGADTQTNNGDAQ